MSISTRGKSNKYILKMPLQNLLFNQTKKVQYLHVLQPEKNINLEMLFP